jgi:hypothetical protein
MHQQAEIGEGEIPKNRMGGAAFVIKLPARLLINTDKQKTNPFLK